MVFSHADAERHIFADLSASFVSVLNPIVD